MSYQAREEATSTPCCEGSCEGRMRKDEKSLKIEGTDKWEWGSNEHIPPRQPDGASWLLVKDAVRRGV